MNCPQCGAAMFASPAPEKRVIVKQMVAGGSQAAYASNFADAIHEKEATSGVIQTCTNSRCQYVTRA